MDGDAIERLKDELAHLGVRPLANGTFSVRDHDGQFTGDADALRARCEAQSRRLVDLMADAWIAAARAATPGGPCPAHPSARAMFVAALKSLAKVASEHPAVSKSPARRAIEAACHADGARFSYDQMDRFVQARLVIDWAGHLAALCAYRAEVVEAYATVSAAPAKKTASIFGRNLDLPGESVIPWRTYYGDVVHRNRHEQPQTSREETNMEQHQRLRQDLGMVDQSGGFLDHYDEIDDEVTHSRRFRDRRGTMQQIWDNNQKWKDFSSVEFGARSWGDTSNLAPHEKNISLYRG